MPGPQTKLEQAIDRLVWEATYLRDVLHVVGPQPQITLSAKSLQQTVAGMIDAINLLREIQPGTVPTVGVPAPVPAQGG